MKEKHGDSLARDFTSGSIMRSLIVFAFPLFLSNLLQMTYNLVDMAVVGNFIGKAGISGVSVGGDITNFLTFVAVGFAEASQVMISQAMGSADHVRVKHIFGNMCSLLLCIGVVVTSCGLLLCDGMLRIMSTPAEAWNEAKNYTTICVAGIIFTYGYNAVGALLRGIGDSRGPFLFIGVSTVVNVVLDLLLVGSFGMGAAGAAVATVASQAVSFGLGLVYVLRRRKAMPFRLSVGDFRFCHGTLKDVVGLGIPMALRHTSVQISRLFVSSWINSYGVAVSAVAGMGGKISMVATTSTNCLHTSGASMVGQNIGAGQYRRVPKLLLYIFLIALGFASVFAALMYFIPDKVFGLLTNDYASLRSVALQYVPVAYLMFLGSATRAPMNSIINGGGSTVINLTMAILDGVVMRIGLSVLLGLGFGMGYTGFWYGDAFAGFTPLLVGGIYLLSGKWKMPRKQTADV